MRLQVRRLDSQAASVFDARSSDFAINTGTFTWAIAFLEKDVAGSSFQQSGVGSDIRKVNMKSNRISDGDHPTCLSSLSGHAPQSDEAAICAKMITEMRGAILIVFRIN